MRQIASAAAAAAVFVLTGCGPTPDRTPAPPAETSTPAPAASGTPSSDKSSDGVIHFDAGGDDQLFIDKSTDVEVLRGTSAAFKAFIADQVANLTPPSGATDCDVGVGVEVYDPAGFARGGVHACGGYAALWGIQDGKWKELIGTQDLWACADLRKFKVPSTMADTCYESMKAVPYPG